MLCRNGQASRLTEDHKPDLPRERDRILKLDGRVDFQRGWRVIVEMGGGLMGKGLAVSRCLGDLLFKEPKRLVECEPDVCRVTLGPECTFVVLGTDGVWDVLSDEDAVSIAGQEIKVRPSPNCIFDFRGLYPCVSHTPRVEQVLQLTGHCNLDLLSYVVDLPCMNLPSTGTFGTLMASSFACSYGIDSIFTRLQLIAAV